MVSAAHCALTITVSPGSLNNSMRSLSFSMIKVSTSCTVSVTVTVSVITSLITTSLTGPQATIARATAVKL